MLSDKILGGRVGGNESFRVNAFATLATYALFEFGYVGSETTYAAFISDVVLEPKRLSITPTAGDVEDKLYGDDSLDYIFNQVHYARSNLDRGVEAADFADDSAEWGIAGAVTYWVYRAIEETSVTHKGPASSSCGGANNESTVY
jgi:hypothetical protein